jgi:hypothetical protein
VPEKSNADRGSPSSPFTIGTCALFGYRPDRDRLRYYQLLVNQLCAVSPFPVVVATNRPDEFQQVDRVIPVEDAGALRQKIWEEPNWQTEYLARLGHHPRNRSLAQFQDPRLVEVYLAKMSLIFAMNEMLGDLLWIDAGFLFSAVYQHNVTADWQGYCPVQLAALPATISSGPPTEPVLFQIPRKKRLFRTRRPHFHGLSWHDMESLALRNQIKSHPHYIAAGIGYYPAGFAENHQNEFKALWADHVAYGRAGTEETIISLMSWRHAWKSLTLTEWVRLVSRCEIRD